MKRFFWLSQLVFTGCGLAFFISLHLSLLVHIKFPRDLIYGGLFVFGIGLIPMWLVVVFSISRGKWKKDGRNWLEGMFEEFPNPKMAQRWLKILWYYFLLFFGLFIVLADFKSNWAHNISAAGFPGVFIAFYGVGFICAWANWKKCEREKIDES